MSWGYTIGIIGVLLAAGVFIDEFFITEKQKDWTRLKLMGLYVHDSAGGISSSEKKNEKKLSIFSWYFLDDWLTLLLFIAVPLGIGMINSWNENGFSISLLSYPAAGIMFFVTIFYSIFLFRWLTYIAPPGTPRIILTSVLMVMSASAGIDIFDMDTFDFSGTMLVVYICASLFLLSLFTLSILLCCFEVSLLFGRSVNNALYHSINAATAPQKSPFKFLAVLLSLFAAGAKAIFF